jgi:periplasmic protein TonB
MAFSTESRPLGPARRPSTWLAAALGALAINLGLFALMPYLLDAPEQRPVFDKLIPQVNVIRLPRPETPVKHRPARLPEPRPTEPARAPKPSRTVAKPAPADLRLTFEINPRLSGGPVVAETPPVKISTFDVAAPPAMVDAAALDRPLTPLSRIAPVYPPGAKHRGIEGWVRVRFEVDERGDVQEVKVIEAEPEGVFDDSVVRCVRQWRFKPGTLGGVSVKARAETTVRFELE